MVDAPSHLKGLHYSYSWDNKVRYNGIVITRKEWRFIITDDRTILYFHKRIWIKEKNPIRSPEQMMPPSLITFSHKSMKSIRSKRILVACSDKTINESLLTKIMIWFICWRCTTAWVILGTPKAAVEISTYNSRQLTILAKLKDFFTQQTRAFSPCIFTNVIPMVVHK